MQPFPAVDYNPLLELSTEMVDSWLENPTTVRQEDDPPTVKEEDGIDARVKEEASDLMKKLFLVYPKQRLRTFTVLFFIFIWPEVLS